MACGLCSAAQSGTFIAFSSTANVATINEVRTATMFWIQPSFPNPPCTTPHEIRGTYFEVGVSTKYALIGISTPIKLTSGDSNPIIGPAPATGVFQFQFTQPGTWRIRAERPVCGADFISTFLEVTVAASGARILQTGASIL